MPSRPTEVVLGPDTLRTDRGVFSGDRIDPGTVELLRVVPPPPATGDLLDLGCGYGPIAVTMAKRSPGATVWAIDTNRRAVALTGENASRLGLTNLRAIEPDAMPPELRFAVIWSNPPIRVGKERLHQLLLEWLGRLTPDGRAYLVVHKHLGGDSLAAWLSGAGHATTKLASRKGYRLLEVRPQ
ncbi:MAG: rRNA (guanine1207-N2)-methyltransferase [Acidimicrobiaceae bacterium]|nr:rRNA (guanine1207-N2)-methyltransferase [Acidimicrobiaceae bacterium]